MSLIENTTQSRLLRISNLFGVGATTTRTNFTVNLNRMTETNNIVRCVCKSVSFPNTGYNVISSGARQNNVFNYEIVADAVYTIVIDEGFYTTQELMTIISAAIEAQLKLIDAGATATMTLDPYDKKIILTVSGTEAVVLSPAPQSLNVNMGNTVLSGAILNSAYKFDSLRDLYGLKNVYVHSTTIAEGNLVDADVENHDILAEVPITVPFGSMVYYESQDDELDSINYSSVRNYDQITISLRDIDNNIIELAGGGETVVVCKLYYV